MGRKSEGAWLSWTEGNSIDLDENDDENRTLRSSSQMNDLELVLPRDWPVFGPLQIHLYFLKWFRAASRRHANAARRWASMSG